MPTHKNLKKMIRARKSKTGESYSTARMHVLANAGREAANAATANADPPNAAANVVNVAPETSSLKETMDAANTLRPIEEAADPAIPAPPPHEVMGAANPSPPLQESPDANLFRPIPQTFEKASPTPRLQTDAANPSRLHHEWRRQQILERANSASRVQQMMAMSDEELALDELLSKASSAWQVREIMNAASPGKKPGR